MGRGFGMYGTVHIDGVGFGWVCYVGIGGGVTYDTQWDGICDLKR